MQSLRQKGAAIIEYAILLSFAAALGFTLLTTTGVGKGVRESIAAVERLLINEVDALLADAVVDPNAIPDKSNAMAYASWLLTQMANRLMDPRYASSFPAAGTADSVQFTVNDTAVETFYNENNVGTIEAEVPDGAVKSIKILGDNILLYDNDGDLIEVKDLAEPVGYYDKAGEDLIYKVSLGDTLSYDKNVTRGTVFLNYNGVTQSIKLSGYDFGGIDDEQRQGDYVKVSYSNYTVYDSKTKGYIDNRVISGLYYVNSNGKVAYYTGTNRDLSEGAWYED